MRNFAWLVFLLAGTACWQLGAGFRPALAGEYDDARVAFGAFDDGLYGFARQELESFLRRYPGSKLRDKARLLLVLSELEEHDCEAGRQNFRLLEKTNAPARYGIEPAALKLQLAYCFMKAGQGEEAEKLFREVVAAGKPTGAAARARYELARICFERHDYAGVDRLVSPLLAPEWRRPAVSLGIDEKIVVWMAGLSRYHQRDFSRALPLLREIVGKNSTYRLSAAELQEVYAAAVECAVETRALDEAATLLRGWVKVAGRKLDYARFSAALDLALPRFRRSGRLAELDALLAKAISAPLPAATRISYYQALIEIALRADDQARLRSLLEAVVKLETPAAPGRIGHLQALLLLCFQAEDFAGTARYGEKLEQEESDFWTRERFYYPYLVALQKLGRCRELAARVPARMPPYQANLPAAELERRFFLEQAAGECLVKLKRWFDAVSFYQAIYGHGNRPEVKLRQLALLLRLAGRIREGKGVEKWIGERVIEDFPLDRQANEKRLRRYPGLVLLVAERFCRQGRYDKAMPSLLWLEQLKLKGRMADRVGFLLADACYRSGRVVEAIPRYEALYRHAAVRNFRYLAALRLASFLETRKDPLDSGERKQLIALYRDLVKWEPDPRVRADFKQKLKALKSAEKAANDRPGVSPAAMKNGGAKVNLQLKPAAVPAAGSGAGRR